jgi:hypothetical protein
MYPEVVMVEHPECSGPAFYASDVVDHVEHEY